MKIEFDLCDFDDMCLLGYDLRGRLGVNSYQESTNRVCFPPVEELPLVGVWERGSVGMGLAAEP